MLPVCTLRWDGSDLGEHSSELIARYKCGLDTIHDFLINRTIVRAIPVGTNKKNRNFPLLVERLKELFFLSVRGSHVITLNGKEKILYRVQQKGNEIIYEVPISSLPSTHFLRRDTAFRRLVQETIVFCDLLCLKGFTESNIRIRKFDGGYYPVSYNETAERANTRNASTSIVTKTLLTKWFGEDDSYHDAGRRLIARLSGSLRSAIEKVVKETDKSYLWYAGVIENRFHKLCDVA